MTVLAVVTAYLVGAVPVGFLIGRAFGAGDIRRHGSGNIGATNVARSSPALGLLTLVLDASKGLAAVAITRAFLPGDNLLAGWAALFAIVGHMFPIWLKFRGGKGVATALGSFVLLAPKALLLALAVFVAVVLVFRQVSLGSMLAVALFPLFAWLVQGQGQAPDLFILMGVASVLIIARHHQNIRRLLAGTEPRFQWRRG